MIPRPRPRHPKRFSRVFALLLLFVFAAPQFLLLSGCKSNEPRGGGGARPGGDASTQYLGGAPIGQPPQGHYPYPSPYGAQRPVVAETPGTPARQPSAPVVAPSGAPSVVARSAIVVDAVTGQVLYEKNADSPRPVASTQKLLTALLITRAGSLDSTVTVAPSDTEVEPYKLGLKSGEVYTRRTLLKALLVRSGNDVAHCLARTQAGSEPAFAALMTRHARSLGMYQSVFANASGLTAPGQFSTARDLSIAGRLALRDPVIAPSLRTRRYTFRFADGRTKLVENTNKLLDKSPYCNGMKTGWTRASGRCLVSSGTRYGRTVIVVVLHSTWEDVWDDSRKLMHWGLGAS